MCIKYIDLFAGIGGFRIAIEEVAEIKGIPVECVFSSEIDESCKMVYEENFNEIPFGDVKNIDSNDIPEHDILFAGFPCQPFSIIGNQNGFDDMRGTLFFDIARILKKKRPKAFLLENVKQLVTHKGGYTFHRILSTLKDLGYHPHYQILNALDYGLPQKRERVFILSLLSKKNFSWPAKSKEVIPLVEIFEKVVPEKYYASDRIVKKRKEKHSSKYYPAIWHENKSGNITSYPYSCALRASASYNYLLVNGERRLTTREMLRLQGFPDSFRLPVSYCQARKQTGNAVPINVVKSILMKLLPKIYREVIHETA